MTNMLKERKMEKMQSVQIKLTKIDHNVQAQYQVFATNNTEIPILLLHLHMHMPKFLLLYFANSPDASER